MFVSVKSLTALIDQDIQFYIEGVASKEQHSPEEFEKWHKYIKSRLVEQLSKLKKIVETARAAVWRRIATLPLMRQAHIKEVFT